MSHPITESDSYDASIVTPDVLDTTYPSDVSAALGGLANRTNYLSNALNHASSTLDSTNTGVFDAGSFTTPSRSTILSNFCYQIISTLRFIRRYAWGATEGASFMYVPLNPTVETDGTGNYQVPGTSTFLGIPMFNSLVASNRIAWYQNGTPSGSPALYWPIRGLPPNGTIVSFSLRIKGAAGHGGLPTSMPNIALYKQPYGGAGTLITTVNDLSANTTQYQLEHDLNATSLTVAIEQSTVYYFKFTGESGTNKLTGLQILDCLVAVGA